MAERCLYNHDKRNGLFLIQTRIIYGPHRGRMGLHLDFDSNSGDYERLPNMKFKPKNVTSKCGSLANIRHKPGGGTKAIFR